MNNIYKKSAISVGKIILAVVLMWSTYLIFVQEDKWGVYFGIGFLIIVTLPTIFVVYFKNSFLAKYPKFTKPWKFLRIIYILILILLALGLIFGVYRVFQKQETQEAINFINSKKITLDDVMGKNLPPVPDKVLNESTIAGIDMNNNYIRDDVELAIFEKYPNSAKIRAAELQYAQALQLELTKVFSSETLVAVMQKEDYGFLCIGKTGPDVSLNNTREEMVAGLSVVDNRKEEVEDLILNTDLRKKYQSDNLKKYMIGYASLPGNECDIDTLSLPN